MSLRRCLFVSVAALGAVVSAEGQKPITDTGGIVKKKTNPFTEEFGEFAKDVLDEWKVPGLSIAFIDDDDVFAEAYGYARLPDEPATPETLWYGGSTTKAFTATTLSQFIAGKNYSSLANGWSTPISSIIHDDFVLEDDWLTRHITLDDAVSHRTGMPRHDRSTMREKPDGDKTVPRDIVRGLRDLQVTAEPRTRFMYNNLMFVTLSHVLERLTGKWLGDLIKETIWEPLGMKSTYFTLDAAKEAPESLAQGYYYDEEEDEFKVAPHMEVQEISGAGAIFSNVLDYAKWLKCLMHEAEPLSEAVHKDLKTPRMISSSMSPGGPDVNLYTLGWFRSVYNGHVIYTHSGGVHAFGAQAYWLPEAKIAMVAFANTCMTSNAAEDILIWKLINERLGVPQEKRLDPAERYRKVLEEVKRARAKAPEVLFPDRPDPALPPSLNASQLAGTYHDEGYGTLDLRVQDHPTNKHEKILVAERPETTWRYKLELQHVSGDWWIAYDQSLFIEHWPVDGFSKAEFRIGADGKATSLEVHWNGIAGDANPEGVTSFKRTS